MVLTSGFEPLLSDPQSDVLTANTKLEYGARGRNRTADTCCLVEGPGIEPDSLVLQTNAITKPAHLPITCYTALFQVSVYFYLDVVL